MRNPAKREKPQKRSVFKAFWWRRGRDSNPCGVAPKRFSRPPRYDRFDTSPYMKLSFDRNHQIFNCFRNSFRNALLCCFRRAEKVRCYKAFQGFCDRYARKFSRPPRYDRFDTSPYMKLSFDRNHRIFNFLEMRFYAALGVPKKSGVARLFTIFASA